MKPPLWFLKLNKTNKRPRSPASPQSADRRPMSRPIRTILPQRAARVRFGARSRGAPKRCPDRGPPSPAGPVRGARRHVRSPGSPPPIRQRRMSRSSAFHSPIRANHVPRARSYADVHPKPARSAAGARGAPSGAQRCILVVTPRGSPFPFALRRRDPVDLPALGSGTPWRSTRGGDVPLHWGAAPERLRPPMNRFPRLVHTGGHPPGQGVDHPNAFQETGPSRARTWT